MVDHTFATKRYTHSSCYHLDTSLGDTFGGLGVDGLTEYREEDVRERVLSAYWGAFYGVPLAEVPAEKTALWYRSHPYDDV